MTVPIKGFSSNVKSVFWQDLQDHLSLSVDLWLLSVLMPQNESWSCGPGCSLNSNQSYCASFGGEGGTK